jgi:PAS domain S-box-containing protein
MKPIRDATIEEISASGKQLSDHVESYPSNHTHYLAFNNSFLANIITVVADGKIIAANQAAAKLLGYTKKALLSLHMKDLFASFEKDFKHMRKDKAKSGHSVEDVIAIKKDGSPLPCQITSVDFIGDNNIKKAISTLVDRREGLRKQKELDFKREKKVSADTILAQTKSDAILSRLVDLEHRLNSEISAKEQLQSSSELQKIIDKKARAKETEAKASEIASAVTDAKELERTDLGMELHDNVNQLLVASRLYLEIAKKNNANREMYLNRSSEYIMNAIEEIRKLAKGLINDAVKNLSLCDAINDMTHDIMEIYPIKIFCSMDNDIRTQVNAKFNLAIFRIVQEQLSNIIKYAKATIVKIDLSQTKTNIILLISDNGSGFDVKKKVSGIGMQNIKNRAQTFQGNAKFVSAPGNGCVLTVVFPAVPLIPGQ